MHTTFTAAFSLLSIIAVQAAVSGSSHQGRSSDDHVASIAALLRSVDYVTSLTACNSVIVNNKAVLSAARCFQGDEPEKWSIRVGSAYWNSGGVIHKVSEIIRHPSWNEYTMLGDLAIVRPTGYILFNNAVQPGGLSGPNYVVPENAPLRIIGWGYSDFPVWRPSVYEKLHEIYLDNLNMNVCRKHYSLRGKATSPTQLCNGFINPEEPGENDDVCFGEPGSPVIHNKAVVGIRSYGLICINRRDVPSMDTRVSSYVAWIVETAEQN